MIGSFLPTESTLTSQHMHLLYSKTVAFSKDRLILFKKIKSKVTKNHCLNLELKERISFREMDLVR